LVDLFVRKFSREGGKKIRGVTATALRRLTDYRWPGNIRELQNVIERALILCDSDTFSVEKAWLHPEAEPLVGLQPALISQERDLIEAALAETSGRISGPTGAARKLGVPRTTLEYKIRSLHIDKYRFQVRS